MKISKTELLNLVIEVVYEDRTMISKIIEAVQMGAEQKIASMSEKILRKDKAMAVLESRHDFGNEKNLEETAQELTESSFNGSAKKYTVEDVKKIIKNI